MQKQAILILAHKNNLVLRTVIEQFDSEYFDIYVHFDKKRVNNQLVKEIVNYAESSKIVVISTQKVTWGAPSVMKAELDLLELAYKNSNYKYFHLISGQDLALKTAKKIYVFFDNSEKNFFEIKAINNKHYTNRIKYRYPWTEKIGKRHNFYWIIQKLFFYVQKVFYLTSNDEFEKCNKIVYSSQWASLTNEFVKSLITHKNILNKIYRYSLVPDEIYKSTFLYKYFQDKDYVNNNFRYDEFNGNSPKVIYSKKQAIELINSSYFFARKFDENQSKPAIEIIKKLTIDI
ncbi:beta-1,6-N-acetylglucosaminyltransferase [Leuconostoc mesenteroides]|uniref:beta-1,6-N-acetylglucosaminyltransferase n=1 Tax=Leuconostoc mesenteroides TaxID=1245 RepID=UPI00101EEE16|nr:beta-1,6-N-acetylglucosaminyltransferase [Leuconostoc mesenteroides]QBC39980.1 hypothetical protein EQK02_06935 [Leuconostoc mesenteroides]